MQFLLFYFYSKNFEHHYSTEEVDNTDYEIITYDTAAVDQANSPNLFSLGGNLKIPATVTNDVSHNGTVVTRRNTSHCSGDVVNTSAEMITTCASRSKSIDESITVLNEAYGMHSLLGDPIKVHDQDPTVTREKIADQSSGLPKRNGKIQQSSSKMTIIKPSNIFIRNDAITTPTREQTVNSFSEIQSGDLGSGLKAPPQLEHLAASDQCTNGIIDEAIQLERNPAYIPIDHTSSEMHWYEEIPYTTAPITSTSSNTSDATIKMEKNPAYHCTTINYVESLIQKHSTK